MTNLSIDFLTTTSKWQRDQPLGQLTIQTIQTHRHDAYIALSWLPGSKLHIQRVWYWYTSLQSCIHRHCILDDSRPPGVYRFTDNDRRRIKELGCRVICDDAAANCCVAVWRCGLSGCGCQQMASKRTNGRRLLTRDARNCVMSRYVPWPRPTTTLPLNTNNETSSRILSCLLPWL